MWGKRQTWPACLAVALATLAAFWPILHNGFVDYDDPDYVTQNPMVQAGVTARGAAWAFSGAHAGNWHPLTWLSHMLDVQWFGPAAGGHHATSLALHAANAVLLLLLFQRLTSRLWPSAMLAALFALHPLRVESVAWVAERKDVLSGFFFILALHGYVSYTRAAGRRVAWYLLVCLLFALGLMAKSMLVTFPFVLLLLDWWPLGRLDRRAVLEKVPLLALSAACSVVTFLAQSTGGAVGSLEAVSLEMRLANLAVSYARYLSKTLWPADLAVFYPYPSEWPFLYVLGAAALLAGVSWLCWRQRREMPWLGVGWLWFLGMAIPVIGLVQVGRQSLADRYTYLPQIGLLLALAFSASLWLERRPALRNPLTAGWLVVLGILAAVTAAQSRVWQNSETLFQHALSVTHDNYVAHNNLGYALFENGDLAAARGHYEEAVRIKPRYPEALVNLALCDAKAGRRDEALAQIARALEVSPTPLAHYNYAKLALEVGRFEDAERHSLECLRTKPDFAEAHYNLGIARARLGRADEAAADYAAALRLRPNFPDARLSLGALWAGQKKYDLAIEQFELMLQQGPGNVDAEFNLASAFESKGDLAAAATHYAKAVKLAPQDREARMKLGQALLAAGKPSEAAAEFQAATQSAQDAQAEYFLAVALHLQNRLNDALPHYREAVRLGPKVPLFLNDLAWQLATHPQPELRDGKEAVRLAEQACELSGGKEPRFWGTLDAAYAAAGQWEKAITTAEKARSLAREAGQTEIAEAAEKRLEEYRKRGAEPKP